MMLLVILFWLPLPLGSNRPWAWSLWEVSVFALTLSCIFLQKDHAYLGLAKFKFIILCWILFLLIACLQVVPLPLTFIDFLSFNEHIQPIKSAPNYGYVTTDIGQSKVSLLKSFAYFCLFLSSLMLINNEKRVKQVLTAMLVVGSLQGIYGILEILFGLKFSLIFNLPVSDNATGSFVYKNHFANFIMLCLSAGTGLIIASLNHNHSMSRREWSRVIVSSLLGNKALVRICLAVMVIALVMSHSRMGNVAFFSALTLVSIYALFTDRKRSRGLFILVVSMIIIDLFIVSSWFGLDKVQQRLVGTSLSLESRDEVVLDAMDIVTDFPLIGSGGGSFYSIFPSYKKTPVHAFYDHAHNDYLQLLIEFGVVGFICLIGLVVMCFYSALVVMIKRRNTVYKGAAFASLMAIIGMLIHMSVDFPLQAPANASYFVVFLALALVCRKNSSRRPRLPTQIQEKYGH